MEIEWHIGSDEVVRIWRLINEQRDNVLVRARKERNLADPRQHVDREQFWFEMVGARLSSAQRAGPESHVSRFRRTKPFPFAYDKLCGERDVESHIARVLKQAGGIRIGNSIARDLAANLRCLEAGEWAHALQQCSRLARREKRAIEKEAYIKETFAGFGPKQSRNVLQALELTRFEIPIDSRVTDWLNEFGFPVRLSAPALGDSNYYDFVSDGIQALCAKAGAFPCILDAAIFARKDGGRWTKKNILY
jgi:hypothetical protein